MYETCLKVSEITNAKEAYYSYREVRQSKKKVYSKSGEKKLNVFLPVELRVCVSLIKYQYL